MDNGSLITGEQLRKNCIANATPEPSHSAAHQSGSFDFCMKGVAKDRYAELIELALELAHE